MQLKTDYQQWYDIIFDENEPVFHRTAFTRGGLSKKAQFGLFNTLNLRTPLHGQVTDLASRLKQSVLGNRSPDALLKDWACIVYHDEYAHRGEGKERMSLPEACEKYPDRFASIYVPQAANPVAFRLVRFGQWSFWLRQQGAQEDWRSNQQEVEKVLSKESCPLANPIPRILWAIDFIPSSQGLLAVDFNTAPDLSILGESKALSADEVSFELHRIARYAPEQLNQY